MNKPNICLYQFFFMHLLAPVFTLFINAFLWQESRNFVTVALYNLALYAVVLFGFYLSGYNLHGQRIQRIEDELNLHPIK